MYTGGSLTGLRQYATAESPLKVMESAFYLILKTFFILVVLTFLCYPFGYVEKELDKKAKVNFKISDVTDWTTNNYKPHTVSCLKK